MKNGQVLTRRNTNIGDAAVDGLLGGAAAGVAMAIYLIGVSFIRGEGFAVLNRFDTNSQSPVVGTLLHLAVAGVYGTVFGIALTFVRRFKTPPWLLGVVFGLALFVLAEAVILPSRGTACCALTLVEIPIEHLAVAHIVYGLVLGLTVNRMQS